MHLRLSLLLLIAATACGRSADPTGCSADADCPQGQRCAAPGGACVAAPDGGTDGGSDGGTDGGDGGTPNCEPACAASQVCTATLTCADAYRVSFVTPAIGSTVTGYFKAQVRVERGSADTPLPTRVELRDGSSPAASMFAAETTGLVTTYTLDYWPKKQAEGTLHLTAAAVAPWGEVSQEVTVPLDDWAPRQLTGFVWHCVPDCSPNSVLNVYQEIADAQLLSASVSVELDGYARSFPFVPSGAGFSASIPLRELPFPFYEKGVGLRLTATDAAGNVSTESIPVYISRFRWSKDLGLMHTTPAVMKDGTLVVGLSRNAAQVQALNSDGSSKWLVDLRASGTAAGGYVTAPPSVGASAIWVGAADGRVYAVDLAGAKVLNGVEGARGCDTGGLTQGPPALSYSGSELAFMPSSAGTITAVDKGIRCAPSGLVDPFLGGASLDGSDRVIAVSNNGTVFREEFTTAFRVFGVTASLSPTLSDISVDSSATAWLGGTDGLLYGVSLDGSIVKSAAGAPISSSPVIAANGDIIFGDDAGVLHRYSPSGVRVWASEPNLGGAARAPMLLSGGDVEILVPTATGKLVGLKGDGTVLWSYDLAPGKALHEGNIYTPPGQSGRVFSTAYFGCDDGFLYAVMVDGELDATSPWPRAHHDPQNTGNARGPRP